MENKLNNNFYDFMHNFDNLFDLMVAYKSIPKCYGNTPILYPAEIHLLCDIYAGINSVTELSAKRHSSKSAISQVIKRLMTKGFIEKHLNDTDRRSYTFELTSNGKTAVMNHTAMDRQLCDYILDSMGPITVEEQLMLNRFLESLLSFYSSNNKGK